jgi:glycyl-tRNA synthetase beta chain
MTKTKDLLIEIGTEELPPKALKRLAEAFADGIHTGLDSHALTHKSYQWYATPRRLAVIVSKLVSGQKDHEVIKRGPALAAAFDSNGQPSKAAEGFARSCGVEVAALEKLETDKGSFLVYRTMETGKRTVDLLADIINNALDKLPIPKRMRWGDRTAEFVRPVHWSVVLFGNEIVPCDILDTRAGNITYGHRFHHPKPIRLKSVSDYLVKLKDKGHVIVDFADRKHQIAAMATAAAEACGGRALIDPDLLDEVTSLVEWPVAITGSFEQKFLELPAEVLIATMQDHQKYFPVAEMDSSRLLNRFVTISNLSSTDPGQIVAGNERVIRPRLTDAAFFWRRDRSAPFSTLQAKLKDVVFQKQLGTLADKTERVQKLSGWIARELKVDPQLAERAAGLAKCDLFTSMVGEFPELQGVMGRYYAAASGEPDEVALALDEQYMPRFAGDRLPTGNTGRIIAIAEKVDTIVGIFGIGQMPTGDKDPFALRRAAIGVLRILSDFRLPLNLDDLLVKSRQLYPSGTLVPFATDNTEISRNLAEVMRFITERARNYLREQGYTASEVDAVIDLNPKPSEYIDRLEAARSFLKLPEAAGLAEADKRIRNIISKSTATETATTADANIMQQDEERALLSATRMLRTRVDSLIANSQFKQALIETAQLHVPVTAFFDKVMVNADDQKLRSNRFALLHEVASLTNLVANISKLAT